MTILSLAKVHRVFLSFRGAQLRYKFVSQGILSFADKDELVIFSRRYAESTWCMDELVKMKKRADKGKLEVIPIFYKVRARDVRGQTGKFGDKFWELAKVSNGNQIKRWKDALEYISNKMGLSLREGDKRYN